MRFRKGRRTPLRWHLNVQEQRQEPLLRFSCVAKVVVWRVPGEGGREGGSGVSTVRWTTTRSGG